MTKTPPWIPNILARPYPLPYRGRRSHKAWDPDLSGKPRLVAGPHHYENTRKGKQQLRRT